MAGNNKIIPDNIHNACFKAASTTQPTSNYGEMCCQTVCDYFSPVAPDKKSQQAVCSRVAQILRREREMRGLSMNLVAERAGLSQQMVSYVEREMRNPTLETLLRIAAAIKIDLVQILREAQIASKIK